MQPLDLNIRHFVYTFFVEQTRPPTIQEVADHFRIPLADARTAYLRLHDQHAIFLEPDRDHIRLANPLSAIPTRYRVHAGGRSYWANCGWDAFGIPAMLKSDATIEALCPDCNEPIHLHVQNGQVGGDTAIMHFLIPASEWYNDLIYT